MYLALAVLFLILSPLCESRPPVRRETKESFLTEKYNNYKELKILFRKLEQKNRNLAKVRSIGKSVKGKDILTLEINANIDNIPPLTPKFKFVANMFGNHAIGRQLLIYLAHYLLENFDKDDRITQLVNSTHIFLIPSMNPDGFEYSDEGQGCDRYEYVNNQNNVNLDTNFPDKVKGTQDAHNIQPETEAMMKFIGSNHFVLSGNLQGDGIGYDYPIVRVEADSCREGGPTSDSFIFMELAQAYSSKYDKLMTRHSDACGEEDESDYTHPDEDDEERPGGDDEEKGGDDSENEGADESESESDEKPGDEDKPEDESDDKSEDESKDKHEDEDEGKPEGEDENKEEDESEDKAKGDGEDKPGGEGDDKSEDESDDKSEDESKDKHEDEDEGKPEGEDENKEEDESEDKAKGDGEDKPEGEGDDKSEGEDETKSEGEDKDKPDGEGETKPEGEGDDTSKGEGADKSEDEDETKPEGDGEDKPDGESEDKTEGEGEDKPDGEGEDKHEGEGEDKPEGEDENKPEGEGGDKPEEEDGDKHEDEGGDKPEGEDGEKEEEGGEKHEGSDDDEDDHGSEEEDEKEGKHENEDEGEDYDETLGNRKARSSDGSGMSDFNYFGYGCFEVTFWLSCCPYPDSEVLSKEWAKNKEPLISFMEAVHWGVKGIVMNDATKPVADALIMIEGNEHHVTTTSQGEYWRLLLPGNYKISVKANGYQTTKSVPIIVEEGHTTIRSFVLTTPKRTLGPGNEGIADVVKNAAEQLIREALKGNGRAVYQDRAHFYLCMSSVFLVFVSRLYSQ